MLVKFALLKLLKAFYNQIVMQTRHILRNPLFIFGLLLSQIIWSQVGVNTANPTTMLDINGDLRVRNTTASSSTDDIPLVIDSEGNVKKQLSSLLGNFRGRLLTDFDSRLSINTPNANGIYKINTMTELIDAGGDFDIATSSFTAPLTGIYEVTITLTISGYSTASTNYVAGLMDDTGSWIMRFSMPREEVNGTGAVGSAKTYTGIAELTAGKVYDFGFASGDFVLLANPVGSTGTGIGSYLKIQLIDN